MRVQAFGAGQDARACQRGWDSRRLVDAVATDALPRREADLGRAYAILAGRFNDLTPGEGLDTALRPFHDRPARVLGAGRFAAAARERVDDPVLRRLPLVGSVDLLLDCADVLSNPSLVSRMRLTYEALGATAPPSSVEPKG